MVSNHQGGPADFIIIQLYPILKKNQANSYSYSKADHAPNKNSWEWPEIFLPAWQTKGVLTSNKSNPQSFSEHLSTSFTIHPSAIDVYKVILEPRTILKFAAVLGTSLKDGMVIGGMG
jgi:hypothetical protein